MEIGLHLPEVGPLATRDGLTAFVQSAEDLGFDSVWVSDHVVVPHKIESRYPYSRDGSFPLPPNIPFLEPVATLLYVAGITHRLKLGTTVLVIPMRNPVIHAKMLATLDVLSNGRLILGVGAGWMQEEFEILGVPFERRGARTSDYIALYKALWTQDNPSHSGPFSQIENVGFAPKPLQKPHPPIWVGGHSAPALKRAGTLADGWHGIGLGPERVQADFERVQQHARHAGRDPDALTLSIRTRLPLNEPATAVALLQAYQAIGVAHVVVEVHTADLSRSRAMMETLANDVRPQLQ
jgi:probable F420-dependent oxidoreductase